MQGEWDLPLLAIGRYFPIDNISSQGRVVIRLGNGQPYLLGQQSGRGRVMLLASPLDAEWNLLPATRFYMELLQSSLHWLAGGDVPSSNLQPGEEWVQSADESVQGVDIFGPPGVRLMAARLWRLGDRREFRGGPIEKAGLYRVRVRTSAGTRWSQLVVQPTRVESNLEDMAEGRWVQLSRELGFMRVRYGQQPLEPALGKDAFELELWGPLLGAALLLLWMEMLIGRPNGGGRSIVGWRRIGQAVRWLGVGLPKDWPAGRGDV